MHFNMKYEQISPCHCSYLSVGPAAGRQQQQSESGEPEDRHPAGHTQLHSAHRHTHRGIYTLKQSAQWTHLGSSVWISVEEVSLQLFIYVQLCLSAQIWSIWVQQVTESAKLTGLSAMYSMFHIYRWEMNSCQQFSCQHLSICMKWECLHRKNNLQLHNYINIFPLQTDQLIKSQHISLKIHIKLNRISSSVIKTNIEDNKCL